MCKSCGYATKPTFPCGSDGRIRIIYVDGVGDFSSGRFSDTDVIGSNAT